MQRRFRDKGWIETKDIINTGISRGVALEIGPGPGYLGLEWLKHTQGKILRGLDISADMIAVAKRNANDYAPSEIEQLLSETKLKDYEVKKNLMGIKVTGIK